jgi:hypothetical protein
MKGDIMKNKRHTYRAWDPKRKVMDYKPQLDEFAGGGTPLNTGIELLLESGIILMQNTGLVSKDGTPIWEGDLLQVNETHRVLGEPDTVMDNYTATGVVEWDDEGADYQIRFSEDFVRGFTTGQIRKVIGNIHTNPELLPKGKDTE